jgi:hypothetical protein
MPYKSIFCEGTMHRLDIFSVHSLLPDFKASKIIFHDQENINVEERARYALQNMHNKRDHQGNV